MKPNFKITIPKPCAENWDTMTLKEKGRFCSSCEKTVVDFTKKNAKEVQSYLIKNKNEQICGHFYKKQLDGIEIEIPQITFQQKLPFQKLFLLALFFVMGTTLFSCQYKNGKKQTIENVILKDSVTIFDKELRFIKPDTNNTIKVEILETIGEVAIIDGLIELEETEDIVMGVIIEEPPRFKESKKLSKSEAKKDFDERMKLFVKSNFNENLTNSLGLKEGIYKIYIQFTIDSLGNTVAVKVRAPHPKLEKEVNKIFKKLPLFIPGKQRNKNVKTLYNLPILFEIE